MSHAAARAIESLESRLLLSSYTFSMSGSMGTNPNGSNPSGSLTFDANGNIYGTTINGGPGGDGTIFEIEAGGGTLTTLASFNGANGQSPIGGVTFDSAGNLYGTTEFGGSFNDGSVFELAKGSHTITSLASFNNTNGLAPMGGVIVDADGNLYGTTDQGGPRSGGTIFELAKGSAAIKTLAFFNGSNGANPDGRLIRDAGGNLYGTSSMREAAGYGTVFELPNGSASVVTLGRFSNSDGSQPVDLVMDASGNLFGLAKYGGISSPDLLGYGTVYEIAKGSNQITTLAEFDGTNGSHPSGLTLDHSGNLVGATSDGTIFEIAKGTSTLSTLARFDISNGVQSAQSVAGVAIDAAGNIYTASLRGGSTFGGALIELPQGSTSIQVVASFEEATERWPRTSVVVDSAGNLFGTSSENSAIFEVPHGSNYPQILAELNPTTDGFNPSGNLAVDSAGNLYGGAWLGGPNNHGSVFELPKGSHTIQTLFTVPRATSDIGPFSNGPTGGVTIDAEGNIYFAVATLFHSAVYEIPAETGTVTLLTAAAPTTPGPIVVDGNGNIYGEGNGSGGTYGNVWELPKGSAKTQTLVAFDSSTGALSFNAYNAGLTMDAAGNLYGVTEGDGSQLQIFEIPHGTNTFTTLTRINGQDPTVPRVGVTADAAGNLYGVSTSGLSSIASTIFELPAGNSTVTTIASFTGTSPFAPVTLGQFGDLYDTTMSGGAVNAGTFFELSPVRIPARLAFAQQPSDTIAGNDILPAVKVYVEDQDGNVVTTDNSTVTLSITSGPTGAALGGTFTAQADDGVVTFDNLQLDTASNYTLAAADGALTGTVSDSFTVTPAVPVKLAFISAPSTVTVGEPMSGVQVAVEDRFDNITGSADPVNISVNLAGGSFTPDSIQTASTENGIASFNQLTIDTAGIFTMEASGGGLADADSPISVTPAATSLTLNQPADATYGDAGVSVSATVAALSPSLALVNEGTVTFTLQESGAATMSISAPLVDGSATALLPIAQLDAGSYSLSATYDDGSIGNFLGSTAAPTTLAIDPAHLTVSANSVSRVYGYDKPPLLGNISGIQNGDPITAIYSTTAAATSTVGAYAIMATLSDNGSGKLAADYVVDSDLTDVGTLTINPADASVRYTGQTIISTGSPAATSAIVTLQAALQDLDGGPAGKIGAAKVQFDVYNADGTLVGQYASAVVADPANAKSGTATASVPLGVGSYQVVIELLSGGSYQYPVGVTPEQAALTVVQPAAHQSIHGAGQLVNLAQFTGGALSPAQAGNAAGTDRNGSLGVLLGPSDTSAGLKSSFAFNVKFGKKGANPKGDVVLIVASHSAPLLDAAGRWTGTWFIDRRVHYYQVHSTSISSVAVDGNNATVTCKADIVDTTDRHHLTLVSGATMQVNVQDGAGSGNDAVNFNVYSPGTTWFNNDFGWQKNAGGGYSQASLLEPLSSGGIKIDS